MKAEGQSAVIIRGACISCGKFGELNTWNICVKCWNKHPLSESIKWGQTPHVPSETMDEYKAKLKSINTLKKLLDLLLIRKWDVLMFGDGAGSSWDGPIGWCSNIVDKFSGIRKMLSGCCSSGTVNMAELLPYTTGLKYYDAKLKGKELLEPIVHIISDSNITVGCGSKAYRAKANKDLWGVIQFYEDKGYRIYWHWVPRDTVKLQIVADKVATLARKSVAKIEIDENLIYEALPSTP
jgi:hypothetical protein